jgi:Winged helix DNA-binding domain
MESLADELEEVTLAGRRAWILATDTEEEEWEPAHGSLRLLPPYDCYVLGCGPREWVVPQAARTRVSTYGRGRFEGATALPVLLIDGVVAGMWEQRKLASRSELRLEAFGQFTPQQHEQLEAQAAHIGAFLQVETALSLGALG